MGYDLLGLEDLRVPGISLLQSARQTSELRNGQSQTQLIRIRSVFLLL